LDEQAGRKIQVNQNGTSFGDVPFLLGNDEGS
jgi:hypothetical protein